MGRFVAPVALGLWLCGCASSRALPEQRAGEINQRIWAMKAAGRSSKADFVSEFGPPSSCLPSLGGEVCDWVTELETGQRVSPERTRTVEGKYQVLRIRFNGSGQLIDARVKVHL